MAAAVLVADVGVAAVGVAQRSGLSGDLDVTMPAGARHAMRRAGTAGFVPATMPDGWTLQGMNVGATAFPGHEARWQLLGAAGASPLPRGVLVGSTPNEESRVIEGATHTVHGQPARVGPAFEPTAPPGALQASWLDGDVAHDAIALGMDEAELLAFLETLVAHDDPATGFQAPTDTPLREVDAATVDDSYITSVTYRGPGGEADLVRVTASSSNRYAGLLHQLVGEPSADGLVHARPSGRRPGLPVRVGRPRRRLDGRGPVVAVGERRPGPALLDDVLDRLEPATTRQLVDIGVAQPVTAAHTVGDWTVEVHGTATEDLAMCLTPGAGATVCTTAEDYSVRSRLTAGAALVDGEWIVVAITEGTEAATVQTSVSTTGNRSSEYSPVELRGER